MATDNVLRLIDEIERLVESGKGWMGKRVVNEEEFFTQIQKLRAALPLFMNQNGAPPSASKSVSELIESSRLLTEKEQLQIVAVLATRLADKSL